MALLCGLWAGGHLIMNGALTGGELASFAMYTMSVSGGVMGTMKVYARIMEVGLLDSIQGRHWVQVNVCFNCPPHRLFLHKRRTPSQADSVVRLSCGMYPSRIHKTPQQRSFTPSVSFSSWVYYRYRGAARREYWDCWRVGLGQKYHFVIIGRLVQKHTRWDPIGWCEYQLPERRIYPRDSEHCIVFQGFSIGSARTCAVFGYNPIQYSLWIKSWEMEGNSYLACDHRTVWYRCKGNEYYGFCWKATWWLWIVIIKRITKHVGMLENEEVV